MQGGSLKKANGRNGKDPAEDSDVEGQKSCDDACASLGIHLTNRKWVLVKGSDSNPYFEVNFKHGGHKRRKIVIPRDARVSLGDDFFADLESCSAEPANLDDV